MYTLKLTRNKIEYDTPVNLGGLQLAQFSVPSETETYTNKTTPEVLAEMPLVNRLSKRNYKQSYLIPVHLQSVLLNLIPEKIIITDSTIREIIDTTFTYFVDEDVASGQTLPYTLVDGIFFRKAGDGVKELKDYTYYLMNDGVAQQIPNYQTLEVMLTERGLTYQSVRVLEESQFADIVDGASLPDNSSSWSPALSENIDFTKFEDLKGSAQAAGAIAAAAAAEADKNIKAVKAEADAAKAEAEAAQAQAQASAAQAAAAQAASQAAIAQADATKAEAEAAKAEAEQLKAEAEAAKAEAEAQKNKKT